MLTLTEAVSRFFPTHYRPRHGAPRRRHARGTRLFRALCVLNLAVACRVVGA